MIEEHQRVERLVLRRGGNVSVGGQMLQELTDLRCAHVSGMPPATCLPATGGVRGGSALVKMDKALDPIDVGFFGSQRIMAQAYLAAHLVQQLELRGWDCRLGPGGSSGFGTSAGGGMNV